MVFQLPFLFNPLPPPSSSLATLCIIKYCMINPICIYPTNIRPRCGVPDISQVGYRNRRDTKVQTGASRVRRYNIQGERWPTSNITWSLRRPSPHLKAEPLRRELAAALKMWSQESSLIFEELTEPEEAKNADIQVMFYFLVTHVGI